MITTTLTDTYTSLPCWCGGEQSTGGHYHQNYRWIQTTGHVPKGSDTLLQAAQILKALGRADVADAVEAVRSSEYGQ